MSTAHVPIRGPYVRHAFAKSVTKGEDYWLQQRSVEAGPEGASASLDLFGIFDGHGGKQAANFAAKQLAGHLTKQLGKQPALAAPAEEDSSSECSADTSFGPSGQVGDGQKSESSEDSSDGIQQLLHACPTVSELDLAAWRAQDGLAAALPQAMVTAFEQTQSDFFANQKVSGSTATLAAFNGWQLVIGNVGDSSAYLDTGSEVLQASASHRLDTNKQEQARVKAAGCEVSSTTLEGKPVGPLRVWPGGLAMSRTLGDWEAGDAVTASPEVRAVAIPHTGARLVIASDGLWDSVQAKTALHHVRNMVANKAATELVQLALKSKTKCRDDITVIVVDAVRGPEDRLPCLLQKTGNGHLQAEAQPALPLQVHRPLEIPQAMHHLQQSVWEERQAAVEWCQGISITQAAPAMESTEELMFSMSCGTTSTIAEDEQLAGALHQQFPDEAQAVQAAIEASELSNDASWTAVPVKLKRQAPTVSPVSPGAPASPRPEPVPMAHDLPAQPQQEQQVYQGGSKQGLGRPKHDRSAYHGRHGPKQLDASHGQHPQQRQGQQQQAQQEQGPDGRRPAYRTRRQQGIPAKHGPQQLQTGPAQPPQHGSHAPAHAHHQQQPAPALFAGPGAPQGATAPVPIMFGTLDPAMHGPAMVPSVDEGMASTISGPPRRYFRGGPQQRRGGQRQQAPRRGAGPDAAAGPEPMQAAQLPAGAQQFQGGRGRGRGPPRRRPQQHPQTVG